MSVENVSSWLADLVFTKGRFERKVCLVADDAGSLNPPSENQNPIRLENRVALPGMVNAHSHAFQRVIRGRTEYRTTNEKDSFWTWREMMYSAASRLGPDEVYDASRMAFLEMALSGITAVGEFHYLHRDPDGQPYDDPNVLSKEVVRAARDVGLRIALLRVAYERSGFEQEPNAQQSRFIDKDPEGYLKDVQRLIEDLERAAGQQSSAAAAKTSWVGVAPHSVRAVSLTYLREVSRFANEKNLPVHMHVAEQPAEVSACIAEYGRSPVALLSTEGLLSENFTGVHLIHVTPKAIRMFADAGATACACPTTERNLGDGIFPADAFFAADVRVALGTDSHTQIDLLEDARELEYHLRLQKMERAVLSSSTDDNRSALASRLFEAATINGAKSIGASGGFLEPGRPADFFTVDLDDPSIAGAIEEDLLSTILFSSSRSAIRDVVVGGRRIVENGRHSHQEEIVESFKKLQKKLWG